MALALWITYAVLYQSEEGGEFPTFSTLLEQHGPLKPLFIGWIGIFFIDRCIFAFVATELDVAPKHALEPRKEVVKAMDTLFQIATMLFLLGSTTEFVGLCGVVGFDVSSNEPLHYAMAGMFFGGATLVVLSLLMRRAAVARQGAGVYGAIVWEAPSSLQQILGVVRQDDAKTWMSPAFPLYLNIAWFVVVAVAFIVLVAVRTGAAELVFVTVAYVDAFWQVMDYRFNTFRMQQIWHHQGK